MIIRPRIRGFVCVTAHPQGCAAHVQEQIRYVRQQGPIAGGPRNVLVLGASTGYGLASRIAAAFGCGANTLGIFFERPSANGRPASAGWYNSLAFEEAARAAGLKARSINGDAFSDAVRATAIDLLKNEFGPIDLVVYSLASPRRTDPKTGQVYQSTLKPIGQNFSAKTVDTDRQQIHDVSLEPASQEEIEGTIKVMGGEDWELWMEALKAEGLLAQNAQSVAYSYIGPQVTWPIYTHGTIGMAKKDLERAASRISKEILEPLGGQAHISVNKALVTQASSAIPVVPLYISLLYKVMKQQGSHEGCIEQMYRLMATQLYSGNTPELDQQGRIRLDDLEMAPDVQQAVANLWHLVTTENLLQVTDFEGYRQEFLKLFGFGLEGVDYEAETDPEVTFPGLVEAVQAVGA